MQNTPLSARLDEIDFAKAAPSSGSVLEPNSSNNTKDLLFANLSIEAIFLICELKVETDWLIF